MRQNVCVNWMPVERTRQWVARVGAQLGAGLIGLVIANAAVQAWASRSDTLLAWKGGGFGMYTEPHDRHRSVWLQRAVPEDGAMRLWPPSDVLKGFLIVSDGETRARAQAVVDDAGALRFYPRSAPADRLLRRAAGVDWPDPLFGPAGTEGDRIVVLQLRHRLAEGRIDLEEVFSHAVQDQP